MDSSVITKILALNTVVSIYVSSRQYRALKKKQPEASKRIMDEKTFSESMLYNRAKVAFNMVICLLEFIKEIFTIQIGRAHV